jgi:Streptomyces sporulation and cell division protein, SsgA
MPQHTAVHQKVATATTEMILISDPTLPAVNAEMRYQCDDPFAVQMLLSVDQSPAISWIFGRELLATGVVMPSGMGDVQIYPTHDGVIIELRSGTIAAKLLAHTPDLMDFTDRTFDLVPLGSEMEHYDLDIDLGILPVHDVFEA